MRRVIILFFLGVLIIFTSSLPSYRLDEDDNKVMFTSYFFPLVFSMDTTEVASQNDKKLFGEISQEANLERKVFRYNGDRIYLDYFIAGFARQSMNFSLDLEAQAGSDFYVDTVKEAKKIYLSEYIEFFKKGYIAASRYFDKIEDPEKLVEKIFFVPFLGNGSPEEYSYVLGTSISQTFFDRYELGLQYKDAKSPKIKEFIRDHAYTLGVIAYIRTRYVQ